MRTIFPNVAQVCDRTSVSDLSAEILINAALKYMGIINKDDSSKVVGRSKIRRERIKTRSRMKRKNKEQQSSSEYDIYFDGRKDKTLIMVKEGERATRKNIREQHAVLISEPGSIYIEHVTLISGISHNMKKSILTFFQKKVDRSKLQAVGCDGTRINTDSKIGKTTRAFYGTSSAIAYSLHANEFPLRYILHHLDSKTTEPKGYCGEF
ncbi:hypothetical protein AVEN_159063-1 [Araneus ventricosus]|uniref:Uncharacterized protein n=1 Tax=Araneus ventricosus TaxID=182803 RepID=A0A4Y2BAW1_ARAVE|nr:hypothetical protein AVEN_159063-1 [Araneus ventricosus]